MSVHEKPRDHARLLSPDEIDGLDTESHELNDFSDRNSLDSTDARLRGYEGAEAYKSRKGAGGVYNTIMSRLSPKTLRHILIGAAVALLLILGASMMPSNKKETIYKWVGADIKDTKDGVHITKPDGVTISGVIFYGRAQFVDILDCYLQKNLAKNGGLLDNVIFMQNTDNVDDIAYLDKLVAEIPEYVKVDVKRPGDQHGWGGFDTMWAGLRDDDTIYLKIDDDIVWIHDDAVPRMIESLLKHPEAHDIAGNIVNSPLTNWLHYHNEAVYPFLPENAPHPTDGNESDWRVNHLPSHDGNIPEEYDFTFRDDRPPGGFEVGSKGGPPYENHRWLMLANDSLNTASAQLMKTPIAAASYDPFGMGWRSWAMAAQQHYSLFKNLEDEQTSRYWFGNAEGIWNMQYGRYNLNFLAIWGSSVAMELPGSDDEEALTVTIPKKFHRPCLVDSHALIAHFNFGTQPELIHTDLLDRYRNYANEFACSAKNQKSRLPKPNKPGR